MSVTLNAALGLARQGLAVLPTASDNPKRPLTRQGVKSASRNLEQIRYWFTNRPSANVAVATGAPSGLFVVDIDRKAPADGFATVRELEARHGALPETWLSLTPSGGCHLWFRQPGRVLRNRVGFAPGLDVRTDGGFVAAPPSKRADGADYEWLSAPWEGALAECPDWLLDLIAPPEPKAAPYRPAAKTVRLETKDRADRYAAKALDEECAQVERTPRGGRNARLFLAAARLGELTGAGLIPEALARCELEHSASVCGLTHDDGYTAVLATINSGLTRGMANPRPVRL